MLIRANVSFVINPLLAVGNKYGKWNTIRDEGQTSPHKCLHRLHFLHCFHGKIIILTHSVTDSLHHRDLVAYVGVPESSIMPTIPKSSPLQRQLNPTKSCRFDCNNFYHNCFEDRQVHCWCKTLLLLLSGASIRWKTPPCEALCGGS